MEAERQRTTKWPVGSATEGLPARKMRAGVPIDPHVAPWGYRRERHASVVIRASFGSQFALRGSVSRLKMAPGGLN